MSKERRRQQLCDSIAADIISVRPGRLLTLLTQALQWQQFQGLITKGTALDLFTNTIPSTLQAGDVFPTRNTRVIRFSDKSQADCMCFSPNGHWLLTGSNDGFVEIWDYDTGKLSKDLVYQANDEIMTHDSGVSSVCWSINSELIGSGSRQGEIKVWQAKSGGCLRKWSKAHNEAITCNTTDTLSRAEQQAEHNEVSVSCLCTLLPVLIHGLKSGHLLKELVGHSSYVNQAIFAPDGQHIFSCSSDGTIKQWNTQTGECSKTITIQTPTRTTSASTQQQPQLQEDASITATSLSAARPALPIVSIAFLRTEADRLLVVDKSDSIKIINLEGITIQSFTAPPPSSSGAAATKKPEQPVAVGVAASKADAHKSSLHAVEFVSCCVSAKSSLLYGLSSLSVLYVFDFHSGDLLQMLKLHKSDGTCIVHHPHTNLLASAGQDGTVKMWKP